MPDPNFSQPQPPGQPLNLGPHPSQSPTPGANSAPTPESPPEDSRPWSGRELGDRLVLERGSLATLGRVSQAIVHPVRHRLVGVVCKTNPLGPGQFIPWEAIRAIGADGIVVQGPWTGPPEGEWPGIAVGGQEVWSELGTRVGRLVDYHLWSPGGAISDYWVAAPGWQGVADGIYAIEPGAIVSLSRKRIMVSHGALVAAPLVARESPPETGEPWGDRPPGSPAVRAALRTTLQEGQEIAAQAQTQAQQLGNQARSRLGQWAGQVKQRTRHLRAQVNDRVADVAANLQERRYPPRPPGEIPGRTIDVDAAEIWPEDPTDRDRP